MTQTLNPPPPLTGSAVASAQRPTPNAQFGALSELELGRWTLDVGRFLAALL
jgi:hypothetical protein